MIGYYIGCLLCGMVYSIFAYNREKILRRMLFWSLGLVFILALWLQLGYWNILFMPASTFVVTYICYLLRPMTPDIVIENFPYSDVILAEDFYNTIPEDAVIGYHKVKGFKQEYDALLFETLYAFTSKKQEAIDIMRNLYTVIHYPVSDTPKIEFKYHVETAIMDVVSEKKYLMKMYDKYPQITQKVFNIWLCQMLVHQKATQEIERCLREYP